jgi:hypothetical protein
MAARSDPLTFKYGQPLFAAAWPCPDILLVAGGGGRPGTGIENRIIAGAPKLQPKRTVYSAHVRLARHDRSVHVLDTCALAADVLLAQQCHFEMGS